MEDMDRTRKPEANNRQSSGWKRAVSAAILLFLCVSVSSCGQSKDAEDTAEESGTAASSISGNSAEGTTEDAVTAGTQSTESAQTAETLTAEEVLPDKLEEGEQVLAGADTGTHAFRGTPPEISVGWDNMPDAIGWLDAPGPAISTGVMKAGSQTEAGLVLDANNAEDFSDPVTILHGSYAAGGTLEKIVDYGDAQFFQEHPYLYVYTRTGQTLEYQVFAAFTQPQEDILVAHNTFDYSEFVSWIESIYDQRSMNAVLDSSLSEEVTGTWQTLGIDAENGGGTDYLVLGTLTGQERTQ